MSAFCVCINWLLSFTNISLTASKVQATWFVMTRRWIPNSRHLFEWNLVDVFVVVCIRSGVYLDLNMLHGFCLIIYFISFQWKNCNQIDSVVTAANERTNKQTNWTANRIWCMETNCEKYLKMARHWWMRFLDSFNFPFDVHMPIICLWFVHIYFYCMMLAMLTHSLHSCWVSIE